MKEKNRVTVYKGNYYSYEIAKLEGPHSSYSYEIIKNVKNEEGGVSAIPLIICKEKSQKKIIVIANYRYPLKKYVLEFPAGCLEQGEDPIEGVKRELKEETGWQFDHIIPLYGQYFIDTWKSNDVRLQE